MPIKKYTIDLSTAERDLLHKIIRAGTSTPRIIMRANILLSSDIHACQSYTTAEIADMLQTTITTIQNVRKTYAENGLGYAIHRKRRTSPPVSAKIDKEVEAQIIALCCSQPPEGYTRWSVRLLSNKCVELGFIESISHMTISRTLKKMNLSLT
jgi:hypothetical protein